MPVRRAVHAGSWYTDSGEPKLIAFENSFLELTFVQITLTKNLTMLFADSVKSQLERGKL